MSTATDTVGSENAVAKGVTNLINNIQSVIYIDRVKLEYLLAAKIAGGHVMLADSHGVGKTSLARALSQSIQWRGSNVSQEGIAVEPFSRIQCTVDLLPQDILGYTRIDHTTNELMFTRGPIFAHFVLCDEINLLTPKTQGSFFQAMEEQTVTIEGRTYHLEDPFFIIATMNLKGAHLFPLPAPQLDRFMIQISMGYPDETAEAAIVTQHGREDAWKGFVSVVSSDDLNNWQESVDLVQISDEVVEYIVACVRETRKHPDVLVGASPRTGVKVSRLIRALALIRGLDYVTIDMVKEVFHHAVSHRLILRDPDLSADEIIDTVLQSVPVERKRRTSRKSDE